MQDTTVAAAVAAKAQLFLEAEQQVRCPRCDSINTKFCYYNNYNLRQPRHFCKSCRRYWTKGGALRNVPVGGSSRKNSSKRPSPSFTSPPSNPKRPNSSTPKTESPSLSCLPPQESRPALNNDESLSSLLASDRQFESLINAPVLPSSSCSSEIKFSTGALEMQSSNESSGNEGDNPTEDLLGLLGDSSCWANWWPDLTME